MRKLSLLACSVLSAMCSAKVIADPVNLTDLYADTLSNNPQLSQALLATKGASAGEDKVNALYRPQVDAGLQYGGLRNDWTTLTETDGHGAEASIRVGQNLYNAELNAASDLSAQQVELADAGYKVALEGLKLSVASGYFTTLKAQENLKQAKATKDAIEEHLKQTKNRYANGLIPENDVKEAQAQFDLAEASVIFAANDVDKALDALYELSGKSYDGVVALNMDYFSPSIPAPTEMLTWEEQAQKLGPQMTLQRHFVDLAKGQIQLAEAGHMPTLGLIAEYRYAFAAHSRSNPMGTSKGDFVSLDENATAFAGVAMNLPVYRGGATSSAVEQANIQYQQALEMQEQTWREVTRNIRSTEKDLNALLSAQRAYTQAVVSAESALEATEQGFEVGSRTIVDVLNSTRQLYSARQQLTESQIDFLLSALNLKFLAGELTEGDITGINAQLKSQ